MTVTEPVHIYTNYDFRIPAFEVKVEDFNLPRNVVRDVVSVSYTDSLDKLDSCQFTLNNWDAEKRSLKYSDSALFNPGKAIELYMGYHDRGGMTLMLRGQIIALAVDFPEGGQSTLQVRALNQLYKLHFKQENLVFQNKKDSEIAQEILEKIEQDQTRQRKQSGQPNFKLELVNHKAVQKEQPREYVWINNKYPIVFLMERARQSGYDIYIEEEKTDDTWTTKLHFHPPEAQISAPYKLVAGKTLISFKPTLKTKDQVAKVTVRGWDPDKDKEIIGEATRDDLGFRGLPNVKDLQAIDSALAGSEEVISLPVENNKDAKDKAIAYLTDLEKDLITGSGSTVGLPELRAGRPIYIEGLGSRFSGRYIITSSTHTIGNSGYTTQFEARVEELGSK